MWGEILAQINQGGVIAMYGPPPLAYGPGPIPISQNPILGWILNNLNLIIGIGAAVIFGIVMIFLKRKKK